MRSMERKHAASVVVGEVIDELGPNLVLDEDASWDGGVMLTLLDLQTGEQRPTFFASFDEVDVIQ
jgi:hypothetical protein